MHALGKYRKVFVKKDMISIAFFHLCLCFPFTYHPLYGFHVICMPV